MLLTVLKALLCFEKSSLWLEDGGGSLAELLGIPSEAFCLWPPYGREKKLYKYLSKVYIYTGISSALLYFSGKTITKLNQRYHYKHLRKVHISNGNFNLGKNVCETVHNPPLCCRKATYLSTLSKWCYERCERETNHN